MLGPILWPPLVYPYGHVCESCKTSKCIQKEAAECDLYNLFSHKLLLSCNFNEGLASSSFHCSHPVLHLKAEQDEFGKVAFVRNKKA